jgi:hypothetical protein
MKPFSEEDREPQLHWPPACRVVVLGVLHPGVGSSPCESSDASPQLPLSVVTGKRSTDVVFYDPISSGAGDDPNRQHRANATRETPRKHKSGETSRDSQEARRKAIAAVARELDRLSIKLRAEKCEGAKE